MFVSTAHAKEAYKRHMAAATSLYDAQLHLIDAKVKVASLTDDLSSALTEKATAVDDLDKKRQDANDAEGAFHQCVRMTRNHNGEYNTDDEHETLAFR
jgi:hypothetical protein